MSSQIYSPPLAVRMVDDLTVVSIPGSNVSLDTETAEVIGEQLLSIADKTSPRRLVLDLGGVQYLCSQALAAIVGVSRRLRAAGGQLAVRNVSPRVYEVFALTRLTTILDVQTREASAGLAAPVDRPNHSVGVLLADEDQSVRNVLGVALRGFGFVVRAAATGQVAVKLYQQYPEVIDLALLDACTPGLDGPATLATLHELNPGLPCCFMSDGAGPYTEEALLELGAARVFRKPFVVAQVVQTLYRLAQGSTAPA
jgi:anti-anti-sigma factor